MFWYIFAIVAAIVAVVLNQLFGWDLMLVLAVIAFLVMVIWAIAKSTIRTAESDENEAIMNQYRGAPPGRR